MKTFVAPSPDTTNLPVAPAGGGYVYPLFPVLDPRLFSKPRIITPLLIKQSHHAHHGGNMMLHSLGSWQTKKSGSGANGAKDVSSSSRRAALGGGSAAAQSTSFEQVIATLWFVLFTAITGENASPSAELCGAALDTAFQVLVNLRTNGLQPEEEIFPCLMFACGSCGVPERAVDVLREMQNSGFSPDSNTYAALLQVFTMNPGRGAGAEHKGHEALASLKSGGSGSSSISASATASPMTAGSIVSSIKERLYKATGGSVSSSGSSWKAPLPSAHHQHSASLPPLGASSSSFFGLGGSGGAGPSRSASPPMMASQTYYQHPFDRHHPSSPLSSPQPLKIAEIQEADRITMFQLQFEMIFAGLEVHTQEICPECDKPIFDQSVE